MFWTKREVTRNSNKCTGGKSTSSVHTREELRGEKEGDCGLVSGSGRLEREVM